MRIYGDNISGNCYKLKLHASILETEYESKQQGGHRALKVMEDQLEIAPYLVGEKLTVADICLYGYTHVAHEGGFSLAGYPAIRRWIDSIAAHPNYVGMDG